MLALSQAANPSVEKYEASVETAKSAVLQLNFCRNKHVYCLLQKAVLVWKM